ncbi:MAG: hypothetical protein IPG75_15505 [Gemmatimonadetes bacterium]|nr:hypothetical protein [Gemmatimonadota bacterium]
MLDGRDSDALWRATPVIDQFLESRPTEGRRRGSAPRRGWRTMPAISTPSSAPNDPHPDSLISLLSRRDDQTASDHVTLMIDSYHDRRTGFEFSVNPAGVKSDYALYNDGNEDVAWDAVWDVATRVDSLGWTAEYRIPLSPAALLHPGRRHLRCPDLARHPAVHRHGHLAAVPAIDVRHHLAVRRAHRLTGLRARGGPSSRPTW